MANDYVLVAEPHRATAASIARAVTELSALPCVIATDGSEGHEVLVQRGAPRLMIVELTMPKRDGFSLIRGMRRIDTHRSIKTIATSSFPAMRKSAVDLAGQLGPIEVLPKPLQTEALARAIRAALAKEARPDVAKPTEPPARSFTPLTNRPTPEAAERSRLAQIEEMGVTQDAPEDAELQRIVEDVARTFGVPTALVTVVLEGKQWFKSFVGLSGDLLANRGTQRAWAFCNHVVEGRDALVVPDARDNPVFHDNPLVVDGTIGGYAGAPIVTARGEVLGTLCILDTKPITVGASDVDRLRLVARRVAGELELSAARRRRERAAARHPSQAPPGASALPETSTVARSVAIECLVSAVTPFDAGVVVLDASRRAVFANQAFGRLFGVEPLSLFRKSRAAILEAIAPRFLDAEEAFERLAISDEGPFAHAEEIPLLDGRLSRWTASPIELPGGLIHVMSISAHWG